MSGGATTNGAALQSARQEKQAKYREPLDGHRSGLIVVGVGTGGRFGQEVVDFVDSLTAAKARDSPHIFASVSSSGVETALDALVRGFVDGG